MFDAGHVFIDKFLREYMDFRSTHCIRFSSLPKGFQKLKIVNRDIRRSLPFQCHDPNRNRTVAWHHVFEISLFVGLWQPLIETGGICGTCRGNFTPEDLNFTVS